MKMDKTSLKLLAVKKTEPRERVATVKIRHDVYDKIVDSGFNFSQTVNNWCEAFAETLPAKKK